MSEPVKAIALDHQDHYDYCCRGNLEPSPDNELPQFYDQGVSFWVRCSECKKEYHENYMLTNLSDPAADDDILEEY